MKRAALLSSGLALGVSLLGAFRETTPPSPAVSTHVRHPETASGTVGRAFTVFAPAKRSYDRAAAVRRKLRTGEAGTYIRDIIHERDSALARWPDRRDEPLTVWIKPDAHIRGFSTALADRVREAFTDWDDLHLPVRFEFLDDSASAEIHVVWVDHFNEPISGRTRWARDDDYVITDANIVLAIHHHQGEPLDEAAMKAMALHEIGHLLGLDHTNDNSSIMAPRVRVRSLSDADRATARLLYSLPPGPIR
jgi:hypothetical protein